MTDVGSRLVKWAIDRAVVMLVGVPCQHCGHGEFRHRPYDADRSVACRGGSACDCPDFIPAAEFFCHWCGDRILWWQARVWVQGAGVWQHDGCGP